MGSSNYRKKDFSSPARQRLLNLTIQAENHLTLCFARPVGSKILMLQICPMQSGVKQGPWRNSCNIEVTVKLGAGPEETCLEIKMQCGEAKMNLFVLFTEPCCLIGLPTRHVEFYHTALTAAYPNKALREGEHTFQSLTCFERTTLL